MSTASEEHIDALLCFMRNEIESRGRRPSAVSFDFTTAKGEDFLGFQGESALSPEDVERTVKVAYSRGYLEHPYCGGDREILRLTTEGHGRAISVEKAKHLPTKAERQHTVNIGAINGPAQIGNQNIQNVDAVFHYIAKAIEQSSAPAEEKKEAK